jgi:phage terminase large subunit-like protein
MVRATIHAADSTVPVRLVTASRGKAVRAEPVSVHAQGQVHHAGRFTKLEDAAIWALTYLFGVAEGTGIIEFYRRESEGGAHR